MLLQVRAESLVLVVMAVPVVAVAMAHSVLP
jgi:hypothetical protein